jgi:hypothetical protein
MMIQNSITGWYPGVVRTRQELANLIILSVLSHPPHHITVNLIIPSVLSHPFLLLPHIMGNLIIHSVLIYFAPLDIKKLKIF